MEIVDLSKPLIIFCKWKRCSACLIDLAVWHAMSYLSDQCAALGKTPCVAQNTDKPMRGVQAARQDIELKAARRSAAFSIWRAMLPQTRSHSAKMDGSAMR